jgi:hypothetical protein
MADQQELGRLQIVPTTTRSHVPGTELLYDADPGASASDIQYLKDKRGNHFILLPQPSRTDPTDPLRWSKTKKWAVFLNAVFYAFMGSVTGPIMAAGMTQLSDGFEVSFQKLTWANGATLVCQGVGNIFWM